MGLPKPLDTEPPPPKPTMTLCDFLLARLKELNAYASRTTYSFTPESFTHYEFVYDGNNDIVKVYDRGVDITRQWFERMQAHEGPADPRLVRMAASMAKIVHRYQRLLRDDPSSLALTPLKRVLCDLASVWSDHPDYDWKWR